MIPKWYFEKDGDLYRGGDRDGTSSLHIDAASEGRLLNSEIKLERGGIDTIEGISMVQPLRTRL
jgi:hypothetical protein